MRYCDYSRLSLCDECHVKEMYHIHNVSASNYYRNKIGKEYFFCSDECRYNFMEYKICSKCYYDQDLIYVKELGDSLCDNNPTSETPLNSCYKEYIGAYTCDLCQNNKNTNSSICYIISNDKDDKDFACSDCIAHHISLFEDTYIEKQIKKGKKFILGCGDVYVKYLKSNFSHFICNECNEITQVSEGINIVGNKNLCNECVN